MGKFHEKIVSSTTETIFQYIVIILPLEYIPYLQGLAMEQVFTNWVFRQSSAPVQMGL